MLRGSCALCGVETDAASGPLCLDCARELPRAPGTCCRCGRALPADGICALCQHRPPPVARTVVAARYAFPVDRLVQMLKFEQRVEIAAALGAVLAHAAARSPLRPVGLVPVPLHRKRLAARGYNQALEIARTLGRHAGLPVLAICSKQRETPPQTCLPAAERARNLRGAFAVTADVRGLYLALVDDVLTTGATIAELARTLRRAGAARVDAWVCARTAVPGADAQVSRLATVSAWRSMKARRGST